MNMHEFADALASKDLDSYSAWFAEDLRLYTPVHEEPSVGKQVACQLLPVVFSLFEHFHYSDVFVGQQTHALVFRAEVSGIPLEGVDYVRTDANGLVTEFSVMMRPLRAITTFATAIAARMPDGQRFDVLLCTLNSSCALDENKPAGIASVFRRRELQTVRSPFSEIPCQPN
jgi:hypothetical protein